MGRIEFAIIGLAVTVFSVTMIVMRFPLILSPYLVLMVGASFWAVFGYWLAQSWLDRDNEVYLFDRGLSIRQRGKTVTLLWPEVESIRQFILKVAVEGVMLFDTHDLNLETKYGSKLTIHNTFERITELGQAIETGIARDRFSDALKTLKQGQSLFFGPLEIDPHFGLRWRGVVYPWREIRELRVNGGLITIGQRDKPPFLDHKGPARSKVPNAMLCIMLVDKLAEDQLGSA